MEYRIRFQREDLQKKLVALAVALELEHRVEAGGLVTSEDEWEVSG
jgi:hypothetical protein